MPKLTERQWIQKKIIIPGDEIEIFEKYLKLIESDKSLLEGIQPVQERNGIFSYCTRQLIKRYVERNWGAFLQAQAGKK